jgi:hypothetical protein
MLPSEDVREKEEGDSIGLLIASIVGMVVIISLYAYLMYKEKEKEDKELAQRIKVEDKFSHEAVRSSEVKVQEAPARLPSPQYQYPQKTGPEEIKGDGQDPVEAAVWMGISGPGYVFSHEDMSPP